MSASDTSPALRRAVVGLVALVAALASACGAKAGSVAGGTGATEITVAGTPATDGIFDAAPASSAAGRLWMSYSAVRPSPHATPLNQVRTRIASSPDGGSTWADAGVDPNAMSEADLQVPDGHGGQLWTTWRFEVSRLLYDPYDAVSGRRWKLLWHRTLAVAGGTEGTPLFQHGWIGLSTAFDPSGAWSAERKLFTGTIYDAATMDAYGGPPEFPLASLYPGASALGGCAAFTEPGVLARPDGVYVSLQCAGAGKIVLLFCDRAFSTCTYRGDLLLGAEAAGFSLAGQSLTGFAAPELVEVAGGIHLLVTGFEAPGDLYRGCLAFRVQDLSTATLVRSEGAPVLERRTGGAGGSFNGACGYDVGATGSGILYGQHFDAAPHYRLFASHAGLP